MEDATREVATLGGGCFWCLEAVFEELSGVDEVVSGYTGGETADPSYREVCSGTTGHAEVVQVRFDPSVIPYAELLRIFFALHDPTTPNRQGADVGSQYRSIIFTHGPEQASVARNVIAELESSGVWKDPIVTEIAPLATFYAAEGCHQGYYRANRQQPYCRVTIDPKVAKLRRDFAERLRTGAESRR